jgi:hypothetical protein
MVAGELFFEMSFAIYGNTRRQIPDNHNLHSVSLDNLKSLTLVF